MTNLEWQHLEATVAHMTHEEKVRLLALVNSSLAGQPSQEDPLLGLMADEPGLMDEIVATAHAAREHHPLRLATDG